MTLKGLKEGMEIFMKYLTEDTDMGGAEHDIIYIVPADELGDISESDKTKLEELGFFIDDDSDSWAHWV